MLKDVITEWKKKKIKKTKYKWLVSQAQTITPISSFGALQHVYVSSSPGRVWCNRCIPTPPMHKWCSAQKLWQVWASSDLKLLSKPEQINAESEKNNYGEEHENIMKTSSVAYGTGTLGHMSGYWFQYIERHMSQHIMFTVTTRENARSKKRNMKCTYWAFVCVFLLGIRLTRFIIMKLQWDYTAVCLLLTTSDGKTSHNQLERALGRAHNFAYHKIGHWIMNMLALVECQLDRNWPCYGKKKIFTFPWPWPWPLTRLITKSNQMVPG